MIEAKDIAAFYGKKQILFGTSLRVSEGERVLLVGPNGAGKSTFLKVVTGLLQPYNGQVLFNGQNITSLPTEKRIHSGIGYLLQSENIVPGITVDENLTLGGYPLTGKILSERKHEVLEIFDFLKDKLSARAGYLSGGERQALAIGMVLMKHPQVLLLDEPSAGLSPKAASQILKHIERAQELMGIKAICMVEHNLKFALPWASQIIILVGGRVVKTSDTPNMYITKIEELEKIFFHGNE